MKRVFTFLSLFCFLSGMAQERFAGLHLDFHASAKDSGIGKYFTAALIDSMLQITKPDYIQVDCKGHEGISSYPTKVGNPAPAFSKDIMGIWRSVTQRHKIPLYAHYSGLWDSKAILEHPQWARINSDGNRDKNVNSMFAGYTDSLLIPQIQELATHYRLNGIWVDGDSWMLGPDYHPEAIKQFKKEYPSIATVPKKPGEPGYFEWMEFHRKVFRAYVTKYANAAHKVAPGFKVTSNWSFSSMMPEPVDIPVDYLSGDVAGTNSLYSSAFESRCLALQGKPWDLMAWSFAWKNNSKATKSIVQMQQEAAQVLAQGGGFQTYWQQNRDGSPEPYQFSKMAEIIKFSNERKAYTYHGKSVPQIGLLYATYSWRRYETSGLYTTHNQEGIKGVLNLLLDNQLAVDILMDHQLDGKLAQYPLIVIPEWPTIDPVIRTKLLQYVFNGGQLLVIGAEAVGDFSKELGVQFIDSVQKNTRLFAGLDEDILITQTNFRPFKAAADVNLLGQQLEQDDWRFSTNNALASVCNYGRGRVGGIYFNMGSFYDRNQNSISLNLIKQMVGILVPSFTTTISKSDKVHQVLTRLNGKLYVHLINTGGPHNNPNVLVYDKVPPVENMGVTIKADRKPVAVKLQPGNRVLPFSYGEGKVKVTIETLRVYDIIEVSE